MLATVYGQHVAFGSAKASAVGVFPRTFSDKNLAASVKKLDELAEHLDAKFLWHKSEDISEINTWLSAVSKGEGVDLPPRFKSANNHYWFLDRFWIWLLLLALPLEVLFRRWEHFIGNRLLKTNR